MRSSGRIPATLVARSVCAWTILGALIVNWFLLRSQATPVWLWIVALAPVLLFLPGLLGQWRNAYAYPMLTTIVYAVIGIMEVISSQTDRLPAAVLCAAALIAFFILIPAVRRQKPINDQSS